MLNEVTLVGRITSDIEKIGEDYRMVIAIPRSYKNADGEYETDFIENILPKNIGENVKEYCKKGDIVGVKGRLETYELNRPITVKAEKVTFLSSRGN